MRCSQAQKLVNDHIDLRLNRDQIESLERHLEACGSCRELLEDMKSMVNEAKRLESVSPSADLWPLIKEGVTGKSGSVAFRSTRKIKFPDLFRFQKPFAFAVSAVLMVIILTALFYHDLPLLQNMRIFDEKPDRQEIAITHLREAERHYKMAIAELNASIAEEWRNMDPELASVFKKNTEIIDNSILACRNAINRYPENLDAKLYLLASYRKKIELLNEIKRITMQLG